MMRQSRCANSFIPAYEDENFSIMDKNLTINLHFSILYSQQENDDGTRSVDILRNLQTQYPNIYHLYLQEGTIQSVNKKLQKIIASL